MPPVFDETKCIKCQKCLTSCPGYILEMGTNAPRVAFPDECWHCNVCAQDCPAGAITLRVPVSHMILHLDSPYLQSLSKENEHAAH